MSGSWDFRRFLGLGGGPFGPLFFLLTTYTNVGSIVLDQETMLPFLKRNIASRLNHFYHSWGNFRQHCSSLLCLIRVFIKRKKEPIGNEWHSWEVGWATQMKPTSRPSDPECAAAQILLCIQEGPICLKAKRRGILRRYLSCWDIRLNVLWELSCCSHLQCHAGHSGSGAENYPCGDRM